MDGLRLAPVGYSLRTLLLVMTGMGILCGLLVAQGLTPWLAHLLLVLAFAVPGGSYGYDLGRTSRAVTVGTCLGAVAGTLLVSAFVLLVDLLLL